MSGLISKRTDVKEAVGREQVRGIYSQHNNGHMLG
jgi:hypothetical protein